MDADIRTFCNEPNVFFLRIRLILMVRIPHRQVRDSNVTDLNSERRFLPAARRK